MLYDWLLETRIGYGWGQTKLYIICAFVWASHAAEMMVVGFLIPILEKQWQITTE
jgi:hypothetical protein